MNFQITPAATMLMARGRKIIDFADRLVADPVDEDGDEQPEADGQRSGVSDDPQDVVAERR